MQEDITKLFRRIARSFKGYFASLQDLLSQYLDEDDSTGKKKTSTNDSSDEEVPKKRSKPVQDPQAPKRPLNSFIMFCNYRRKQLKEDGVDMDKDEMLRKIGDDWNSLTEAEKGEWTKKAKQDQQRYIKEAEEYNKKQQQQVVKEPAQKAKVVDTAPKEQKQSEMKGVDEVSANYDAVIKMMQADVNMMQAGVCSTN